MSLIGPVTVSPIGGHEMHLLSMSGDEELGRLFEYNLELLSPDPAIPLADVLGAERDGDAGAVGGRPPLLQRLRQPVLVRGNVGRRSASTGRRCGPGSGS